MYVSLNMTELRMLFRMEEGTLPQLDMVCDMDVWQYSHSFLSFNLFVSSLWSYVCSTSIVDLLDPIFLQVKSVCLYHIQFLS